MGHLKICFWTTFKAQNSFQIKTFILARNKSCNYVIVMFIGANLTLTLSYIPGLLISVQAGLADP